MEMSEVLHVETRKRGDAHRGQDPKRWNSRPDFIKLHRHKKSVTIDISTDQGKELVKSILSKSDVLIENYALGVIEHWGLTYDELKQLKSDIILVRVKGLGSTGLHAADKTYGPNIGNITGTTFLWTPGLTVGLKNMTGTRLWNCCRERALCPCRSKMWKTCSTGTSNILLAAF